MHMQLLLSAILALTSEVAFSSSESLSHLPKKIWLPLDTVPVVPQRLKDRAKTILEDHVSAPYDPEVDYSFSFKDYVANGKNHFLSDLKNNETAEILRNRTSDECLASMHIWIAESSPKLYSLRMWDSWAKPEGGVLEGNVVLTGHYFECRLAENDLFSGKYCHATYGIFYIPGLSSIPIDKIMGFCFPSTCTDQDVAYLYRHYFRIEEFPPLLTVQCSHESSWMTIDTVCAVICAFVVVFCFAGTLTDYFVRRNQKENEISGTTVSALQKNNPSAGVQFLLCFSVVSNGEKILDTTKNPNAIPTLDGVRFISTTWVILGHTLQTMAFATNNAVFARRQLLDNASSMVILNGVFSVDTFFFLSGLLVAYLGLKHITKQKGFLNVPLMYLQRYLRLTPLYAFLILFTSSLYKYLGVGPGTNLTAYIFYQACKDDWWANILYINNFYPISNSCFPVAWYLANDWQFFVLSPLFIFLLYKSRIAGVLVTCLVILGSTIVNGVLVAVYNLQPVVIDLAQSLSYFYRFYILGLIFSGDEYTYEDKFQTDTYTLPWARIHVYMIGMLTGYVLFANKGKVKMNKVVAIFGWVISATAALAIIYAPWIYVKDMELMPSDLSALYNALSRPAWGACLAWVVIACCSGYGGIITTFLDWKAFKPFSRLTYSAYLVHVYVLYWYGDQQEGPFHYLTVNFVYMFFGTVFITFAIGFVVSLLVEWPFIALCKLLFNPSGRHPNKHTEIVTSSNSPSDTASDFSSSEQEKKKDFEIPMNQFTNYKEEAAKECLEFDNKAFENNMSVAKL